MNRTLPPIDGGLPVPRTCPSDPLYDDERAAEPPHSDETYDFWRDEQLLEELHGAYPWA